jgi:hypothetical protein
MYSIALTLDARFIIIFCGEFCSPLHENYRLSGFTGPEHGDVRRGD